MGVLRAGALGYVRKDAEPRSCWPPCEGLPAEALHRSRRGPAARPRWTIAKTTSPHAKSTCCDSLRSDAQTRRCHVAHIGEETVKTHVGHVLAKLQVENRAQAIIQALKRRPGHAGGTRVGLVRSKRSAKSRRNPRATGSRSGARMNAFGGRGIRIVGPPVGMTHRRRRVRSRGGGTGRELPDWPSSAGKSLSSRTATPSHRAARTETGARCLHADRRQECGRRRSIRAECCGVMPAEPAARTPRRRRPRPRPTAVVKR